VIVWKVGKTMNLNGRRQIVTNAPTLIRVLREGRRVLARSI
jgi:hypothetical protein